MLLMMLMMRMMIGMMIMIISLALVICKLRLLLIIKIGSLLDGLEVQPSKLSDVKRLVSYYFLGEVMHDLR